MFSQTDVQLVFSGKVANEWETKGDYINIIEGNDNQIIPIIKKNICRYSKTSPTRILEVGCGTGRLLGQIDSSLSNIVLTGVEISPDMIHRAYTSKFRNPIELVNTSIESFSTNKTYNIIVMKQVLHHIASKEFVLKKLSDILSPDGIIIIMTPNENYQKDILAFNQYSDPLGRISDSMLYQYVLDSALYVEEIQHTSTTVKFDSLYKYFMFLHAIGSLQKIYGYKKEYEYALQLIQTFQELFCREWVLSVDFNYSYITLCKYNSQEVLSMNHNDKLRVAFNDWAKTYEDDVVPKLNERGYSYSELAATIVSYINTSEESNKILELGTGTGILGKHVKEIIPETDIDGLDIAPEMIKKAKRTGIYKNLILQGASEYPYNTTYNFIFSAFMFHSVENQEVLLDKLSRHLSRGGIFILVDLVPNMKILPEDVDYNMHSIKHEHGAPAKYRTCTEMIALIEKSPLELIELRRLGISKDFNHYLFVLKNEGKTWIRS